MNKSIIRTSAVLTAAAGLLLAPVAANAQTIHDRDTRGDVVQISASGKLTPVPAQVNGDIVRTRFRYADKTISVVAHFADLKRVGDLRGDFLQIKTNEGLQRQAVLLAQPGDWAGTTLLTNLNGDEVTCAGITHSVDYGANTVRIGVPRSCLSNPRWVKLGFGSGTVIDIKKGTETFDDALRHGPVTGDDAGLAMSAHIHRTT